jgi:hypothetical protein
MGTILPELISFDKRTLAHKTEDPQEGWHVMADPSIRVISRDSFTGFLDKIPYITDAGIDLSRVKNIVKDN